MIGFFQYEDRALLREYTAHLYRESGARTEKFSKFTSSLVLVCRRTTARTFEKFCKVRMSSSYPSKNRDYSAGSVQFSLIYYVVRLGRAFEIISLKNEF